MSRLKKEIIFWAFAALAAGLFYFSSDILTIYKAFPEITESAPRIISDIKKEISAPAPLRIPVKKVSAVLTRPGVINWTNVQRKENGNLPLLKENLVLNTAAEAKLKEMVQNQYSEHVSPAGIGPGELVESAGYEYIASGETCSKYWFLNISFNFASAAVFNTKFSFNSGKFPFSFLCTFVQFITPGLVKTDETFFTGIRSGAGAEISFLISLIIRGADSVISGNAL